MLTFFTAGHSCLMARPSSSVSGLRMRSSGVSRAKPKLKRKIQRLLTPNSFNEACTPDSKPMSMDATTIATNTPITTPSTVRNDRTLCVRIVSRAILMFSANSFDRIICLDLNPECLNRIELGGFVRRVHAGNQAHDAGNTNGKNDRLKRHPHRQRCEGVDQERVPMRAGHSYHAADGSHHRSLHQKLQQDIAARRA